MTLEILFNGVLNLRGRNLEKVLAQSEDKEDSFESLEKSNQSLSVVTTLIHHSNLI